MALPPRDEARNRLASETFDVLVIGGGITGAGVALDAATRGLKTAIVERGDWACGTSSKSSKLIHGGLRYLQQKEYRLVYENLRERQRLLRNAPHLVSVLPFLIPVFGKPGVVSKTVSKAYGTALWLYDVTGGWRVGKRHRRLSASDTVAHMRGLSEQAIAAGFLYYDARADDVRLTLTVLDSAVAHGVVARNYTAVTGLRKTAEGRIDGALLDDGTVVRARCVVNAAGVWAEEVQRLDGTITHHIRPAKGVHIAVPAEKIAADIAAVVPVRGDRRSIFVIPVRDDARSIVYLGTTDTDYDGPLDEPACTRDDIRYVLDAVNAWLAVPLEESDVLGAWAGLRPLLVEAGGKAVTGVRTADLSRRHAVARSPSGLVSILGGKLTTYRQMAEDTVDEALAVLGAERRRCRTRRLPLRAVDRATQQTWIARSALDAHLIRRYGSAAPEVRALVDADAALGQPLVPGLPSVRAEAIHAVRAEQSTTLSDVLSRRTRAALYDAPAAASASVAVAALIAPELGWDEHEQRVQVERFIAELQREAPTLPLPSPMPYPVSVPATGVGGR